MVDHGSSVNDLSAGFLVDWSTHRAVCTAAESTLHLMNGVSDVNNQQWKVINLYKYEELSNLFCMPFRWKARRYCKFLNFILHSSVRACSGWCRAECPTSFCSADGATADADSPVPPICATSLPSTVSMLDCKQFLHNLVTLSNLRKLASCSRV